MANLDSQDEKLNMSFFTPHAALVWKTISSGVDAFAQPLHSALSEHVQVVDRNVENSSNAIWSLNTGGQWPEKYIPIRGFRSEEPIRLMESKENELEYVFQSSGTTTQGSLRSKSGFTHEGSTIYRRVSLKTFADVLYATTGIKNFGGVSLIPPTTEWKVSSLAQMLGWMSSTWDIEYANYLNPSEIVKAIEKAGQSGTRPVFVFGTAFHFIDLLDMNVQFHLPKNSVVVETGGTKGRTRSVTRDELYELIANGFHCSTDSIISEYGMCELASQAYDFVPVGTSIPLKDRRFKFPWWSPIKVMSHPSLAEKSGVGALTIWDLARTDIGLPIQTEDLVDINEKGEFKLLGRLETAPLKGCSLNVKEVIESKENLVSKQSIKNKIEKIKLDPKTMLAKSEAVLKWLQGIAVHKAFEEGLAIELESSKLAKNVVLDFKNGLPQNSAELVDACLKSFGGQDTINKSWVVIPPSSHSLASLFSLALLFTAGVAITVRTPRVRGQHKDGSALDAALKLAESFGLEFKTLGCDWRLSPNNVIEESLLVFGDDFTISAVKQFCKGEVYAQGNALAASITSCEDWDKKDLKFFEKIILDNKALRQRGCMSVRLNFVEGVLSKDSLIGFTAQIRSFLSRHPEAQRAEGSQEQTARSLEYVRLSQLGGRIISQDNDPFIVVVFDQDQLSPEVVSKQELVFIVVECKSDVLKVLKDSEFDSQIKLISTNLEKNRLSGLNLEIRDLGKANQPKLNGLHFNEPMFLMGKQRN